LDWNAFFGSFREDASMRSLLFANIVSIVFVVAFNWSLFEIALVYVLQSIIIGLFVFLKMVVAKPVLVSGSDFSMFGLNVRGEGIKFQESGGANVFARIFILFEAGFFALHYGIFHAGYLFAVFLLLGANAKPLSASDWLLLSIPVLIFFANHAFSFYENSVKKRQRLSLFGSTRLFSRPYMRIIPMHLTIILFAFVSTGAVGGIAFAGTLVTVFFLCLKTFADLVFHYNEHKDELVGGAA